MATIQLIVSFLVSIVIGWNILFWIIRRDRSFAVPEKIALSYIIGLGAITLQMLAYSLLKIKFSIGTMLLPWLFIICANFFILRKTPPTGKEIAESKKSAFDIALLMGITFQVFYAFFKALVKPEDSFDAIGNFAFKAKMFFESGRIPFELFLNKNMDIQHGDYPLFIPLSQAWTYMFIGGWNDLLVKALFPMFFVALLIILYFTLRRITGNRLALVSAFFMATIPHFLNYATIGYADFALAMFYSISFFYLFLWIAYKRENKYLLLAAVLSILAIWAKNEGALLSLISISILLLFVILERKEMTANEMRGIAYFSIAVIAAGTLWFVFIHSVGLSNEFINKDTLKGSLVIKNLGRIPLILNDYQKHVFGPKKWNISLLVFFAGLILYFKTAFKGYTKYITLSILFAFLGYGVFYLITPLEIKYHLQTAGSRVLLHFLPVVVFWIGYMAKEITDAENNIYR